MSRNIVNESRLYAIIIICAFVLPNLYFIVIGRESFPFTQAPMFGHYIGDSTRFYEFSFILEDKGGEKEISPDYVKRHPIAEVALKRFFFGNIYGSVETTSPFGYYKNDTREALEKRMTGFFSAYFKSYSQELPQKIRLDISRYNREYAFKEKHTVGYYDIQAKKFIHTWKEQQ